LHILLGAIELHAKNNPSKVMLADEKTRITYEECFERIGRLSAALEGIGFKRGESLALVLQGQHEFIESYLACMLMGVIPVVIGEMALGKDIAGILASTKPKALVVSRSRYSFVADACRLAGLKEGAFCGIVTGDQQVDGFMAYERLLARHAPLKDLLSRGGAVPLFFTAGTTGAPKGVFRTSWNEGLVSFVLSSLVEFGFHSEERHLVVCPLYHSAPFFFSMLTLAIGGTLVLMPSFKPALFLETLSRERITSAYMHPNMLERLLGLPEKLKRAYKDFPDLRILICAGAPLFPDTKEGIIKWLGDKLSEFYGSTEAGINLYMPPGEMRRHITACGRPFPGNELKILDENGNECPPGVTGSLLIKNPWMADAYYKDEEATRKAFKEGFARLGDLMLKDQEGYYTFIEHESNVVSLPQGDVFPYEIERAFRLHPGVLDAAVFGVPGLKQMQRVVAFVVLKPGKALKEGELVSFLLERLEGFKVPQEVVFVQEIPRNSEGKALKSKMRQSWLDADTCLREPALSPQVQTH
jgi:acyl-CoA synthetase (AMP-forming)/AMP-acid ligase II